MYEAKYQLANEFQQARVLVIGDVMLDRFICGTVERISPEAPIPVLLLRGSEEMAGGAGNVARNCAALGARVILIGVVGEDIEAESLRGHFATNPRIDARLMADRSRSTTVKTRYVAEGQQVLRADRESCADLSASLAMSVLASVEEALPTVDIVVLSDYAKGVLSEAVTHRIITASNALNKRIVVDPKTRHFSKYRGATILTPNRHELQRACRHECVTTEQIVLGARHCMKEAGCSAMIVTRGADGMTVVQDTGAVVHLPTTARDVFDVSGAGDTVIATLALCLVCGDELVEAADVANTAAGLVVTKRGTALIGADELSNAIEVRDSPPMHEKILTREGAVELVQQWRKRGESIAFTNGCFDLLHAGHLHLVREAKAAADKLIVGLNSDASVRRLKGRHRPIQTQATRAMVLASLEAVDSVVLFEDDTPRDLIEALAPDVLIKGADYAGACIAGAEETTRRGGRVVLVDLLPGHSTTGTLRRLPRPARVFA